MKSSEVRNDDRNGYRNDARNFENIRRIDDKFRGNSNNFREIVMEVEIELSSFC